MSTFDRVALWNTVCGKVAPEFGTLDYFTTLRNQAKRIQEELDELVLAVDVAENIQNIILDQSCSINVVNIDGVFYECTEEELSKQHQEILDAGCDLDVVVAGLNFLSGHAYSLAIEEVLANNDAKYTGVADFAIDSLESYGDGHRIVSTHIEVESSQRDDLLEGGFTTYVKNGLLFAIFHTVHRDKDDKIMKLLGHPKVDLIPFTRTEA
jgi:hypothetical protein